MSEYRLLPLHVRHKDIPDKDSGYLEEIGGRVVFAPGVIKDNLGVRFHFPIHFAGVREEDKNRGLRYFVGRPRRYVNGEDRTGLTYSTQHSSYDMGWVGILKVTDEAQQTENEGHGHVGYTKEATVTGIAVFCRAGSSETRFEHEVQLMSGLAVVDFGGRIFPECGKDSPTSERERVSTFQVTDGTLVLAAPANETTVNDAIERLNRPLRERRERRAAKNAQGEQQKAQSSPVVLPLPDSVTRAPRTGRERRRAGNKRPPKK